MSLYLTRSKYSPEGFKDMIANPSDREAVGRAILEAAGVKVHHMWYSGDQTVSIVEGDAVAGSAAVMVIMATGRFTSVESIELITMGQMIEAMKGAGAVAAKFRPPGK